MRKQIMARIRARRPVDMAWLESQPPLASLAKNSAELARRLEQIRESRYYKSLGFTWPQYCMEHAGISGSHANSLILRYAAFGEAYFLLSGMMPVSPKTYGRIAHRITDGILQVDGRQLTLTWNNACELGAAVRMLRIRLRKSLHGRQSTPGNPIVDHLGRVRPANASGAYLIPAP